MLSLLSDKKSSESCTYKQLHRRLTLFCTCITQAVILALTCLCVLTAEKNIMQSSESAFLTEINSILSQLQAQNVISHQWLNQLQENGSIQIYLYDNDAPLFYESYHTSDAERKLCSEALAAAKKETGTELFFSVNKKLISHTEFSFSSDSGLSYYASAGSIPKTDGHLNFLILRPLANQKKQFFYLRLIIFTANILSFLLLYFFFGHFIRKITEPVETAQKKQTQFIASASHELRTPLAIIRSGLESVEKSRSEKERQHFIRLMKDETIRMKQLIEDMLLLASSDSGTLTVKPERCQPDVLLLDVYEKFESLAKQKDIRLTILLPDELSPDCFCDIRRAEQIFSILIDNAISYTPAGGKVALALKHDLTGCYFSFSDTGCGIPDNDKKRIFERFYRADAAHSDREHFGLGLCIAKELTEKQNGSISVSDAPAGGSCFTVKLPLF